MPDIPNQTFFVFSPTNYCGHFALLKAFSGRSFHWSFFGPYVSIGQQLDVVLRLLRKHRTAK